MTNEAARVLRDALDLAADDRAKLAAELLTSLDHADDDVESAWAAEIARRAADARSNPHDEQDWRIALDEIQREVLSRGERTGMLNVKCWPPHQNLWVNSG